MSRSWRRRLSACLLPLVVGAGCARGDDSPAAEGSGSPPVTVTVDGQTLEVGRLREAVAGLCLAREQASRDVRAAKATYEQRSRDGVETTTHALRTSYSIAASTVADAAADVEADLAAEPPRPTLSLSLGILAERTREGLARLGIPTSNCKR